MPWYFQACLLVHDAGQMVEAEVIENLLSLAGIFTDHDIEPSRKSIPFKERVKRCELEPFYSAPGRVEKVVFGSHGR